METCPFCGAPGSYREAVDGCCYVCGMMLPESQGSTKSTTVEIQAESLATSSTEVVEVADPAAATIELKPPTFVAAVDDTVEPPAIKLIQPRNLSPEYARRVTAAWQATKSPFQNPQETLNSSSNATGDSDKLLIGSRSLAGADEQRPADYELGDVIGEGNMGTVWAARQASLDRQIAIKMPKGSAAKSSLGRELFISEVVVTGQLDHPNIVPIYDLARDESGQLFYAMKRVEGRSWDQCMHEESRTRLENVEILMKCCDAIRFAHDRGVIHRDIKPQNIMVGSYGEVSVMDWGIALKIDVRTRTPGITKLNPSGTPAYMAPEMATGNAADLGPHTDVYLLGAVLYEIITGEPPHPAPDPSHDPFVQQNACLLLAARNVITPAKETGELTDIAYKAMATDISDRFQSVDEFQDAIRDYYSHSESIALTDRGQGHLTAATEARNGVYEDYNKARFAFGEALQLWSENSRARSGLSQATIAHAGTALKRGDYALGLSLLDRTNPAHAELLKKLTAAKRKADRNRYVAFASVVAALSFLVLGIAGVSIFAWRESAARSTAEAARADALQQQKNAELARDAETVAKDAALLAKESETKAKDEALQARDAEKQAKDDALIAKASETKAKDDALSAKEQETKAKQSAQEASYRSEIGLAAEEVRRNAFASAYSILTKQADNETQKQLRNWEWDHLMYLAKDSSISRFEIEGVARVEAVAISPDQKWIAAGTADGEVHVWWRPDPSESALKLPSRSKEHAAPITALAISQDKQLLVSAAGKEVRFWTLPAGDGARELVPAGKPLTYSSRILSVALSPNADSVLTSADDSLAQLWNRNQVDRPIQILRGHVRNKVWQARFSPNGQRIATAGDDNSVRVWDTQGRQWQKFEGHRGPVFAIEFSSNGEYVVSGGRDRRLLAWKVKYEGAPDKPSVAVREGLLSGDEVGENGRILQLGEHAAGIRSISFSPDGKVLYSASDDNSVRVWSIGQNMADAQLVVSLRGHGGWVRSCAAAADGIHVLSGSYDGTVHLWDREKYAFPRVLRPESEQTVSEMRLTSAASSSDARWIATAAENGAVTVWDMANPLDPKSQLLREGHDWQATTAAYFSGGSRLLTAGGDNSALVWDTERGNQLVRMGGWNTTGGTGWRGVAAVSHDGRLIATGSDEPGILATLWDASSGQRVATLKAPEAARPDVEEDAEATAVAFAPRDDTLFVGDQWGRGYLFHTAGGALIKPFDGHSRKINAAAFLPNGRLLTASTDKTVAEWNIQSNEAAPQREREFVHGGRVMAMDISHDGKLLITAVDANEDHKVLRLWDVESGKELHHLTLKNGASVQNNGSQKHKSYVVRSVAFHPAQPNALVTLFDPNTVFDPSDRSKSPYQVGKWEWGNTQRAFQPQLSRLDDTSLAVYAPGREAAVLTVGGRGARLRLANANKVVMSYRPQSRVQSVAFSPDNQLLACAGDDGSIKLWRLADKGWQAERKLLGQHQGPVNSVAFHPTQSDVLLSAGDDGTARLWRRAGDNWDAEILGGQNAGQGSVRQGIFSMAENKSVSILTAADDGVKIWSENGQLVGTLPHGKPVQCVGVSSKWIVTGVGSEAWVWEAAAQNRLPVRKLGGHSAAITSLAFSPDGERLFTASQDFNVKLWDTKSWDAQGDAANGKVANGNDVSSPVSRELLTLEQHRDSVVSVSFFASPTNPSLLTAGADGQAILWPSIVQAE